MNDKIKIGLLVIILGVTCLNSYKINQIDTSYSSRRVETAPTEVPNKKINTKQNQPKEINANPLMSEIPDGPTTSIFFEKEIKDFGNVEVNSKNKYSFEFVNNGSEPLKISNARGSCGCTVPKWPKEPIMPGKKGKIDVVFTPNKSQAGKPQQKTVTITANTKPANTVLNIKAFVNPEGK